MLAQKRAISSSISAPWWAGTRGRRWPGSTARCCRRRRADVALQVGVVGQPAARARVEVQRWVSSRPSLPLCHGNIAPAVAGLARAARRASRQPPVAVAAAAPGSPPGGAGSETGRRTARPRNVPPVGLAVQPAGRHARRRGRRCAGTRSAAGGRGAAAGASGAASAPAELDVAAAATGGPRPARGGQQRVEAGGAAPTAARPSPGLADRRSREVYRATTFSTVHRLALAVDPRARGRWRPPASLAGRSAVDGDAWSAGAPGPGRLPIRTRDWRVSTAAR